jgi:hypothetical protein
MAFSTARTARDVPPTPAGDRARRQRPGSAADRVLALHRRAGNRAVTRLLQRSNGNPPDDLWERVARQAQREFEEVVREADELERIADDLLGGRLQGRPTTQALEELAQQGDQTARRLLEDMRRLGRRRDRLFDALERARARAQAARAARGGLPGGGGQGGAGGGGGQSQFDKGVKAGEKQAGKEAEKTVVKQAGKEAEKTVVKQAGKEAEKTVVKEAGKKAAKEALEEVARPRRLAGLGAKVGKATLALIDGLMPDPTDAIALLIQYAESFKAAQEAVRKRNLEKGFAIGWACYVLFPTWERAQTFARTYVEKDVITQIIDAVGIAENAYNEGLVRGFRYGEKHTTAQLDNVRQRALDAVHRSGQTVNGYYLGNGVYQFVREDVYLFAGALLKAARDVLADSERRKEAREEAERLERNREQIERDYEIDMARK